MTDRPTDPRSVIFRLNKLTHFVHLSLSLSLSLSLKNTQLSLFLTFNFLLQSLTLITVTCIPFSSTYSPYRDRFLYLKLGQSFGRIKLRNLGDFLVGRDLRLFTSTGL